MLNHVPVCDVKPKLSVAYLPVGSLQSPVVTLNRSVSAVFQQWQHEQNVLNTDHRVCQDKGLSVVCVRRCAWGYSKSPKLECVTLSDPFLSGRALREFLSGVFY